MKVRYILEESFTDYKHISMVVGTYRCGGKCYKEKGLTSDICQNSEMTKMPIRDISARDIVERYIKNPVTRAICFGGLEPFEQFEELYEVVKTLRDDYGCGDDVVIYTGYREDEVEEYIHKLKKFENIIVKFGRFLPEDKDGRFDDVLGVRLVSKNQYAKKIS